MESAHYCCPILTKTGMCQQILLNSQISDFMEIYSAIFGFIYAYIWTDQF
jgi:hypothetical protein